MVSSVPINAVESRTESGSKLGPNPDRILKTHIQIRCLESRSIGSSRRFEKFDFDTTRRIRDSKKFEGSTALVPINLKFHPVFGSLYLRLEPKSLVYRFFIIIFRICDGPGTGLVELKQNNSGLEPKYSTLVTSKCHPI